VGSASLALVVEGSQDPGGDGGRTSTIDEVKQRVKIDAKVLSQARDCRR
jgi:hypothetical protein